MLRQVFGERDQVVDALHADGVLVVFEEMLEEVHYVLFGDD